MSGHPAAPSPAMKSRRRMSDPRYASLSRSVRHGNRIDDFLIAYGLAQSTTGRLANQPGRRYSAEPRLGLAWSLTWTLFWAGGRLSPSRCFHLRRRTDRRRQTRALTSLLRAAFRAAPGPLRFGGRFASDHSRHLPRYRARA